MVGKTLQVEELVSFVRDRAVELHVQGDRLSFRGAVGSLSPQVRRDLVQRRTEILRFLQRPPSGARRPALAVLYEPLTVGALELRNRLVLSPMEVDLGEADGTVSSRTVAYYAARARGGVGLVVVEATCVDAPTGRLAPTQLVADRDESIPGLTKLARAIHEAGARAALQLQHAGRKTSAALTGVRPVAPSPIANHLGETPRELAAEEILALARRFGDAAARAQLAGFDTVEIHAGHGYLQAQFLSPTYNERTDEYGGSAENRGRFLLETVKEVRRRVGQRFPVLCRLSAVELAVEGELAPMPGGLSFEETRALASRLEEAGVAAIDLSATLVGPAKLHPMAWPEAALLDYARELKGVVSLPVSLTSRVPVAWAAAAIEAGDLDMVRLGRPLLADPNLPRKVEAAAAEQPRPCIYCSECLDGARRQPAAVCAVNPRLGREGERETPAQTPRTVIVVGGGPAGMEAAISAARRGHRVTLFERSDELGGQLRIASKPPAAARTYDRFLEYQRSELERSSVNVRLGEELRPEALEALGADVLVLATGARPRSTLPGDDAGTLPVGTITAVEALDGASVGDRVAVIGGGLIGCETALKLAGEGRSVTLFHRAPALAERVPVDVRTWLLWDLEQKGVDLRLGAEGIATEERTLIYRQGGREMREEAGTVVLAIGARPGLGPWRDFSRSGLEIIVAGDCREPRDLRHAVHDGYWGVQNL